MTTCADTLAKCNTRCILSVCMCVYIFTYTHVCSYACLCINTVTGIITVISPLLVMIGKSTSLPDCVYLTWLFPAPIKKTHVMSDHVCNCAASLFCFPPLAVLATTREGVWRSGPRRLRSHDRSHLSLLPQVLVMLFLVACAILSRNQTRGSLRLICVDVNRSGLRSDK